MLEFTKDSFDDLEMYKDLYPYDYYTTKENLTETLIRLIFKAFNHGKMVGTRADLNKINIDDTGDTYTKITFELIVDGEIKR